MRRLTKREIVDISLKLRRPFTFISISDQTISPSPILSRHSSRRGFWNMSLFTIHAPSHPPSVLNRPPAFSTFHPFPRLPFEIQQQIWLYALPPPDDRSIIYVALHHWEEPSRFVHTGSHFKTLQGLGPLRHPAMPPIRPVHISDEKGGIHRIYVRPEFDILYLSHICCTIMDAKNTTFDFDYFLADEDNQRNIRAIAVEGKDMPIYFHIRTGIGRVIRGLRNLEKVYVISDYKECAQKKYWRFYRDRWDKAVEKEKRETAWNPPRMLCGQAIHEPINGSWERNWSLGTIFDSSQLDGE
jgi:hypothetical protein